MNFFVIPSSAPYYNTFLFPKIPQKTSRQNFLSQSFRLCQLHMNPRLNPAQPSLASSLPQYLSWKYLHLPNELPSTTTIGQIMEKMYSPASWTMIQSVQCYTIPPRDRGKSTNIAKITFQRHDPSLDIYIGG